MPPNGYFQFSFSFESKQISGAVCRVQFFLTRCCKNAKSAVILWQNKISLSMAQIRNFEAKMQRGCRAMSLMYAVKMQNAAVISVDEHIASPTFDFQRFRAE